MFIRKRVVVVYTLAAELEKAKEQLLKNLKNSLVDELEVNEKMRSNQVKLEEQLKSEVEKIAMLTASKRMLQQVLATKKEAIKVLTDGANRTRVVQ